MLFHESLSDSKSPQVSRILLSILADPNYVIVWMVFTRLRISNSSSPSINPLVTVPSAPITIGITVTFIFHSFFSSLVRSMYLPFFMLSFSFTLWSAGTAKSIIRQVLSFFFFFFFFFDHLVVWLRLSDPLVSQNSREFWASQFSGRIVFCIYHIFVWSNINFLHNF